MRANYRKYQGGWAWLSWAVPAAASALGSIMGNKEAKRNREAQYDFAQHGVQWKVEDAQRAGVHPVYALGASTSSFSPVTSGSSDMMASAGAQIGQGLRQSRLDRVQQELASAQIAKDHAQAMMYANEAARIKQAMNSGGTGGYTAPPDVLIGAYDNSRNRIESHPLYQDAVKLEPDPMMSRDSRFPGQTAGRGHPSMREFTMANGDKVLLPATGQGGIPEEIDVTLIPDIIGANIRRYGGMQTIVGALFRWFGYSLPELQAKGEAIRREFNRTGRMPGDR